MIENRTAIDVKKLEDLYAAMKKHPAEIPSTCPKCNGNIAWLIQDGICFCTNQKCDYSKKLLVEEKKDAA